MAEAEDVLGIMIFAVVLILVAAVMFSHSATEMSAGSDNGHLQ